MSRKILLFLSIEHFHANVWKDRSLNQSEYFSNTVEGLEKFADFLHAHHDPVYLLVDLIEEDFRQETVPHLTGSNHHALVQRKFDQYYSNTPYRLTRLQQRQSEGRRDDELLFSALTNPSLVSVWLDVLLSHQVPVAGIYSIPHATTPLIKDLDSNHLLLLSWEKDAGLRQSYFLNKQLRFSRLTPIHSGSSFAEVIATETNRTRQYLHSLSLTPHSELLNVHIICHAKDRAHLDAHLSSNSNTHYAYLDLPQLGSQLKLKYDFQDSDATPLFLHLLAIQAPRTSYASPDHTHYFKLWQAQRAFFSLATLTAVTCLIWTAFSYFEGSGVANEINNLSYQTSRMLQEAEGIIRKFPSDTPSNGINPNGGTSITASASDMKSAVTLFRNLQVYSVPPEKILQGLTNTLDNFPRIRTSKLDWKMTASADSLPEQVITFYGELADFGNDYRGSLNYLEHFQLALSRIDYIVTPIKLPLDFSSKGSIRADIGSNRNKPSEFSLKITWRPKQ